MSNELCLLAVTSASIGFIHTVAGPDHYLPFIVMARARRWSVAKTAWITFLCGLGHVGSSVALGLLGVGLGLAVGELDGLEAIRGSLAAWAFIAFGLVYLAWGLRRAARKRSPGHDHRTVSGFPDHSHSAAPSAGAADRSDVKASLSPWILFTIFVLGPCEPLIPLVMYPAARHSVVGLVLVTAVFGAVTMATMIGIALAGTYGITLLRLGRLERYSHAIAGGAILLCGISIQFLGL